MDSIEIFESNEPELNEEVRWCSKIYYNNNIYEDTAPIFDVYNSIITSGLGFIEDIVCKAKDPYCWFEHYDNISRSINALKFNLNTFPSREVLQRRIEVFISKNHYPAYSQVRLIVGQSTYKPQETDYVLLQKKLPRNPYDYVEEGKIIEIYEEATLPRMRNNWLRMPSPVYSMAENWVAENEKIDGACILNVENRIVGTTLGNIYLIKGNNIIGVNPSYGTHYIAIESTIKNIIHRMGYNITYAEGFTAKMISDADELFTLSDIIGIRSIIGFEKTRYFKKKTSKIAQEVSEYINGVN